MLNFLASCCSFLALLLTLRGPEVAFTHITLIDGTGAAARTDITVVVRDSTIVLVRPSRAYTPPVTTRVIDGRGKFLLPGFIDMHAHVNVGPEHLDSRKNQLRGEYDPEVPRVSLGSLLRFGVTTIRDPGGLTEHAVATRNSVARGYIKGPRMFVAGSVIDQSDGPGLVATVHSPDEVRAEVQRQVAAGVDYIKLYAALTRPMVEAGIQEAHAAGKKAIGHLFLTSWTDAARAGIDGLVHVTPSNPELLPADTRLAFRKGMHNTRFMFQWFEYVNLASSEIDTMIAEMVTHHVEHDGTLATFEAMAWGDSTRITANPELAYAAPSLVRNWHTFTLTQGWTKADYDSARAVWPKVLQFEKLLYDRGVLVTVGTDANNPWTVPGASYHRELELLVAAGIPPLQVLRLATESGAQALGLKNVGTVQEGNRADLVLLSADPIADIRHTRDVELVMENGQIAVSVQHPSITAPNKMPLRMIQTTSSKGQRLCEVGSRVVAMAMKIPQIASGSIGTQASSCHSSRDDLAIRAATIPAKSAGI